MYGGEEGKKREGKEVFRGRGRGREGGRMQGRGRGREGVGRM